MKPLPLAGVTALGMALCLTAPLVAQEVDHSRMDQAHEDSASPGHQHDGHGEAQPRTPVPVLTDADRSAARPSAIPHATSDDAIYSYTLVDRAEAWDAGSGAGFAWGAEGWIGGDINRLWWSTAGERLAGSTVAADFEALFGRAFSSRWDWVVGLRQDIRPRESRSFVAFGLRGLAPQWFEVTAMAYAGEGGRTALRLSSEYSLRLTNRLVLQPVLDVDLYGKDDASRGIGSGLATTGFGLRLRQEFTRQFAPYLGVAWERAWGDTARLRRATGDAVGDTRLVAGLRVWF